VDGGCYDDELLSELPHYVHRVQRTGEILWFETSNLADWIFDEFDRERIVVGYREGCVRALGDDQ
jgi:hypothetical protein